jgi:hypothetical protein
MKRLQYYWYLKRCAYSGMDKVLFTTFFSPGGDAWILKLRRDVDGDEDGDQYRKRSHNDCQLARKR